MEVKPVKLALGVQEDCIALLTEFGKSNSTNFQSFCKVWQEMQFSFIFICRENFADLYEFCEEVIDIAKQFILPPRNLEERIGGLFLLYGLYNKVPIEKLVKINVTMSEWTDIMDLHNEIQQNEIFDANYILSKMICDDAFVHSFLGKEMVLVRKRKARSRTSKAINSYSMLPSIKEFTNFLNNVQELSDAYEQDKAEKCPRTAGGTYLSSYSGSFIGDVMKDVARLEDKREQRKSKNRSCKNKESTDFSEPEDSDSSEDDDD